LFAVADYKRSSAVQRTPAAPATAFAPRFTKSMSDVGRTHGLTPPISLRGRPRRGGCRSGSERGATRASNDRKVMSVRRPMRTDSSLRSRTNPHSVVLPRPVILHAVATVTVRGFSSGGCGSGNSGFTTSLSAVLATSGQAPSGGSPDRHCRHENRKTGNRLLHASGREPKHACVAEARVNRPVLATRTDRTGAPRLRPNK
jgi:hypothetical protein